jgi:hypothetical protein
MDLGIFNLPQQTLPRISCFDEIKLRRMILVCSNPEKGVHQYSSAPIRTYHYPLPYNLFSFQLSKFIYLHFFVIDAATTPALLHSKYI